MKKTHTTNSIIDRVQKIKKKRWKHLHNKESTIANNTKREKKTTIFREDFDLQELKSRQKNFFLVTKSSFLNVRRRSDTCFLYQLSSATSCIVETWAVMSSCILLGPITKVGIVKEACQVTLLVKHVKFTLFYIRKKIRR